VNSTFFNESRLNLNQLENMCCYHSSFCTIIWFLCFFFCVKKFKHFFIAGQKSIDEIVDSEERRRYSCEES
jgi:hypothetical protein